jgi:hypothetical protein
MSRRAGGFCATYPQHFRDKFWRMRSHVHSSRPRCDGQWILIGTTIRFALTGSRAPSRSALERRRAGHGSKPAENRQRKQRFLVFRPPRFENAPSPGARGTAASVASRCFGSVGTATSGGTAGRIEARAGTAAASLRGNSGGHRVTTCATSSGYRTIAAASPAHDCCGAPRWTIAFRCSGCGGTAIKLGRRFSPTGVYPTCRSSTAPLT